jgi:hypothetical protein
VRSRLGPEHVARVAVAVQTQPPHRAGALEARFHGIERLVGDAAVRGLELFRDEAGAER